MRKEIVDEWEYEEKGKSKKKCHFNERKKQAIREAMKKKGIILRWQKDKDRKKMN